MLLLLVVQRHLADGVLQADRDLAVVGNALTGALLILVETHLLEVDHTVHIVPRPAGTRADVDLIAELYFLTITAAHKCNLLLFGLLFLSRCVCR